MDQVIEQLDNRLRLWRVSHGLTMVELGDLTGLSESMVSYVERGERKLAPLTKARVGVLPRRAHPRAFRHRADRRRRA